MKFTEFLFYVQRIFNIKNIYKRENIIFFSKELTRVQIIRYNNYIFDGDAP
jgi:hypothetical protein